MLASLLKDCRLYDLFWMMGLVLAYVVLADISLTYFSMVTQTSIIWPPSGLSVAALLIGGKKYWPGVFLGALAGNIFSGESIGMLSIIIASGNTLEALACVWLLAASNRFESNLTRPRHFLLLTIASCIGASVSALIGTIALYSAGFLTDQLGAFIHWWQGDVLGIVMVTPLVLIWKKLPEGWFDSNRALETLACFGLCIYFGQIVFLGWHHDSIGLIAKEYWMLLFVFWGAVRFGRHGALLVLVISAIPALLSAAQGVGLYSEYNVGDGNALFALINYDRLFEVWLLFLIMAVVGMTLALEIERRRQIEETLLAVVNGTVSLSGSDFFNSMVRHLASTFKVKYAFVTECLDPEGNRVRSLAFWKNGSFGETLEYDVKDTPCHLVTTRQCSVYYASDVQAIFPKDQDLVDLGSESYLGTPVYNLSNVIIGHLVLMHSSPIEDAAQVQSVLQIFAARAGAELQRQRADKQLNYQASHDNLTGLVNRREFERRAERLLETVRQDKTSNALCFMDLDQFKVVNDTCGHIAGDELLRQLSTVLENTVRHRDTLARLGGDEFGVLIEHCSLDDAFRIAESLQNAIQEYQFSWQEQSFKVGVSIGLVPISDTTSSLTELLKEADAACYIAKDMGRNRIHVYHSEDSDVAKRDGEMQWITRLYNALENDSYCLYAQEIVPLQGEGGEHYELLIRMIDDTGQIIPPGAFLPAAERYNLIAKLDCWVIAKAFTLLKNHTAFLDRVEFCSINLSGQSISDPRVLDFIIGQLDSTDVNGRKLCFEITETAAISNLKVAMKFIAELKDFGCRFALDDFGSGLSSFAYLKNLPVDYLKIDGMFVKDIAEDPIDHAMVKSINEIGQVMGMETIAEFVENDQIKDMLQVLGVNYAQGYGIGVPVLFNELIDRKLQIGCSDDV